MNTLRDFYYDARPMTSSGLKTYYRGLLDKLQSYRGAVEATPLKKYVFIIDEINRGNVSQIFGELITLIEDTKRLGAAEQLTATLPYSNDEFGVPPNLYILGTMNTADRSVEALDTALRRRFSFTEMPPVYDLEQLQLRYHGIVLSELLETLNKRIEVLLDRDHRIGHSYFLESPIDLQSIFHNKIIPLLQEYFFGDYGKIGLVLGRGFVEVADNSAGNAVFAEFDYDEAADLADRRVYRLALPASMSSAEFDRALQLLMS
jgi:5-methylcytosine-specific restriction protein B